VTPRRGAAPLRPPTARSGPRSTSGVALRAATSPRSVAHYEPSARWLQPRAGAKPRWGFPVGHACRVVLFCKTARALSLVVGHEAPAEWPWQAPLRLAPWRTTNAQPDGFSRGQVQSPAGAFPVGHACRVVLFCKTARALSLVVGLRSTSRRTTNERGKVPVTWEVTGTFLLTSWRRCAAAPSGGTPAAP